MKEFTLEGRPDDEVLSSEELGEIAKIADALTQVASAMRAAKTVGDAKRLAELVERLDRDVMGGG